MNNRVMPVLLSSFNGVDFDVLKETSKIWEFFEKNIIPGLIRVVIAILVYLIGKRLIKLVIKILKRALEKAKLEIGIQTFLSSAVRIALYAVLAFSLFDILGVATTTIVAVLGSLGLTIGLALQGSLSNFAGGVLILVLKPYRVGDFIIACGEQGNVTAIDIFYTKLTTADNKKIMIPNGTISNANIVNVSNEPFRRVELMLPVAYATDIKLVKNVLQTIADGNEKILKDHSIDIYIDKFADSSIDFGFRVWVKAEDFWTTKCSLMEQVKEAFEQNNIEIPFNQLDVMIKNAED